MRCLRAVLWRWIATLFCAGRNCTTAGPYRAFPCSRGEVSALPDQGQWILRDGSADIKPLWGRPLPQKPAQRGAPPPWAPPPPPFFSTPSRRLWYFDSIDMSKAWFQSRYDKGETEEQRTAYLNCPMDREQYEAFIDALFWLPKKKPLSFPRG